MLPGARRWTLLPGFLMIAGTMALALLVPFGPATMPIAGATVPSGLVAAWGFDEGTGTTVGDASGNGNIGSITAATWTPTGRFGGALSFNGVNSMVTVADSASLHLGAQATIEAWVQPASVVGWRSVLLKERASGLSYALYGATNSVSHAAGYLNTGGADVSVAGPSPLPVSAWSHVAIIYD